MSNLLPQVTEMRGRTDSQFRIFDLIFDSFQVHVVLRGSDPDEVYFCGKNGESKSEVVNLQRTLNIEFEKSSDFDLAVCAAGYEELDRFIREYHQEIVRYFTVPSNPHPRRRRSGN